MEHIKVLARGILGKGAYDAAAHYVKRGILWLISSLASVAVPVGAMYFLGIDVRAWFPRQHAPIETGSIPKTPSPQTQEAIKKELECLMRRQREIDALIVRRKSAYQAWETCKSEWRPKWLEKGTAEEACAKHLTAHLELARVVREREAKQECSVSPDK